MKARPKYDSTMQSVALVAIEGNQNEFYSPLPYKPEFVSPARTLLPGKMHNNQSEAYLTLSSKTNTSHGGIPIAPKKFTSPQFLMEK